MNHPNLLNAAQSVLLIVDMQTKLSAAMPENEASNVLRNTARLCESVLFEWLRDANHPAFKSISRLVR